MTEMSTLVEFWFRDGREREGWLMVGQHVPRPCDGRLDASGAGVATHRQGWSILTTTSFRQLQAVIESSRLMSLEGNFFALCSILHAFHSVV
jgi:hypothetical protein